MNVHELTLRFFQLKNYEPKHVNELLDFSKRAYLDNVIALKDYRLLVRELEAKGAQTPDLYLD